MITELLQKTQHWPLHALLELVAYIAAYRYYLYLRKHGSDTISTSHRLWIFVGAAAGALLGSRILAFFENPDFYSISPSQGFAVLSNKTIVGGLLGGLFGVEITKKIIGEHRSSGDLLTYPLILGMMIGRIGCFFAGRQDATYGIPTSLPWGIDLGDGLARHPTNLYEILFLAALWLFLRNLEKHRPLADGARFKCFMIAYLGFRFCIEFLKPVPTLWLQLSAIQIACWVGLIYYAPYIFRPARLFTKETPEKPWPRETTSSTILP